MKDIKTCDLVNELVTREAAEEFIIDPHINFEIKVKDQTIQTEVKSGPCRILIIWD